MNGEVATLASLLAKPDKDSNSDFLSQFRKKPG